MRKKNTTALSIGEKNKMVYFNSRQTTQASLNMKILAIDGSLVIPILALFYTIITCAALASEGGGDSDEVL